MRIPCPYCGARDTHEFAYLGDATLARPDPAAPDAAAAFHAYVYLRDNPAGAHLEYWYHAQGCRRWLVVERDTLSHEIRDARLAAARPAAGKAPPAAGEATPVAGEATPAAGEATP